MFALEEKEKDNKEKEKEEGREAVNYERKNR